MRRLVALVFILSLALGLRAQYSKTGGYIAVESGLMLANMYGPDAESETSLNGASPSGFYANHPASTRLKAGTMLRVLFEARPGKYFGGGIGTGYARKGCAVNATSHWNYHLNAYEDVAGIIYWRQDFWTLQVPATFYYPVKENDLFFRATGFYGRLLNSIEKGRVRIDGERYSYSNDRHGNDKEFGFSLSAGYIHSMNQFPGAMKISLEWGRTVLPPQGAGIIPNPQEYYNQTFSLVLGYRYHSRVKDNK